MKRKICVVTGTRAEYFLLRSLIRKIRAEESFILQLAVTGTHLDSRFGYTYQDILDDGFQADRLVDLNLKDDSSLTIASATGRALSEFAKVFSELNPDLIVVLGDRYEMLGVASAALIQRLPVAHLFGGDTTVGAIDESIRHSISKMSHLHFPTNEDSCRRLRAMGEDPRYIFDVGSPGLDVMEEIEWMSCEELEHALGFQFLKRNLLVTFHPETLAADSMAMLRELLDGIERAGPDFGIIFTRANADPQGQQINKAIDEFVKDRSNARVFASLGSRKYLSLMKCVNAVVGNSSSGIYEAPALKVPTVNIGRRQEGRIFADSVLSCNAVASDIAQAIQTAMTLDCRSVRTPYGTPGASARILEHLKAIPDYRALLYKTFYEEVR